MTIPPEQLATWRALADAATAGPWPLHDYHAPLEEMVETFREMLEQGSGPVFWTAKPETDLATAITGNGPTSAANAAFIAAARTAVPALLDECERLQSIPLEEAIKLLESEMQTDLDVARAKLARAKLARAVAALREILGATLPAYHAQRKAPEGGFSVWSPKEIAEEALREIGEELP